MYIRNCNITALIFLGDLNVGAGLNLNRISILTQYRKIVTRYIFDFENWNFFSYIETEQ